MRKQIILLIAAVSVLLSACDNDEIVSKVNRTADLFGARIDSNTSSKKSLDDAESDLNLRVGIWYTWSYDADTGLSEAPNGTRLYEAFVFNVVDGDTVDIRFKNGDEERVRLILVDAPESKGKYEKNPQPYALDASAFTKELLLDRKVLIEKGIEERDKYGRLLAFIWLDQVVENREVATKDDEVIILGEKIGRVTINELLLREGFARVAIFPPNTQYVDEFEAVQKIAKENKKGVWSK